MMKIYLSKYDASMQDTKNEVGKIPPTLRSTAVALTFALLFGSKPSISFLLLQRLGCHLYYQQC